MTTIDQAIETFVAGAQRITNDHMDLTVPRLDKPVLTVAKGRKYAKIIRKDVQSSVHCFVDLTNGDVLMAASWRSPAKHARGNIFDADNGLATMGPYGAGYIR